jgi:serine/threonine-protein kinase
MVASAPTRSLPVIAKYDVLEEIGHGGMATVYRAMDTRLAREVAVKVIHPHLRDSAEVAHRFVVEAQAVAKLRHTNIVEVFDVSADGDAEKYLVVELVRGSTLRQLLKERAPLPPEIAAVIAVDILAALAHAHAEGVVHRDVKPENVLIEHRPPRSDGDTPPPTSGDAPTRVRVKLTDFGIAKLLDAQGVTSTGQVLGSPAHMAPEQIEGGAVDARADVFGLGVLLYEAMVGHLPFEGQNPAQVLRRVLDGLYPSAELERPTIGKRLSVILDRALAHEPTDRFESAVAMRDALLAELRRVGIDAPTRELESWFDDPAGYTQDHARRTIDKLCALAQVARKEDRTLDAAADYNRALAYAPNDPQLLRIVAGMQRAAARKRMLRRAIPLAAATVLAMGLAYWVTELIKHRPHPQPIASNVPTARLSADPPTSASAVLTASATVTATTSARIAATAPTQTGAVAKVERTFTLTLAPSNGVMVAVDNDEPLSKSTGDTLVLNEHEHTLHFTCAADFCDPQARVIPKGTRDEPLTMALHVKEATIIVVDADPNAKLAIEEYPNVEVKVGQPVSVVVPGHRYVVLVDRSNPSLTKKVDVRPGLQVTVPFPL